METHDRFVRAIREKLERKNLSVRATTLRAGLPVRGVQGILEGHVPSIDRAAEVARALGIRFYIGALESGGLTSSVDPELVGILAERILKAYKEREAGITPRRAAELAVQAHDRIVNETEDKDDRFVRVGEYIADLRRTLLGETR